MRLLEILILTALGVTLLSRLWRPNDRPQGLRFLPGILVALTVIHLGLERYRWSMVPAYLLVAILALLALRRPTTPAAPNWGRRIGRALAVTMGLVGLGLSGVLAAGFPIFEYPEPTGPHGVGTARLFFVDRARVDSFAPTPGSPRELLAAVWYPATVAPDARRDPFWPVGSQPSEAIGLPAFIFSHVPLVSAHSVAGAPMAASDARFPVIVFSHGFNSTPWQNVPQMEELASHGFIVVSIGHTYDATVVTFPDGRSVRDNSKTRPPHMSRADYQTYAAMLKRLEAETEPAAIRAKWRELQAFAARTGFFVVPSIPVWVADVRFVLDQLTLINAGSDQGIVGPTSTLRDRMDLDRLGVFGMSFGGSTAGLVCRVDSRCKAGINFDGWQFGDPDSALAVPFLYMTKGTSNHFAVYHGSTADLYEVNVRRSEHGNFGDLSLVAPLFTWIARPSLPLLGTIEAPAIERIMTTYSRAFFQQYLQGKPQAILANPSPTEMPDVVFTARPGTVPAPSP